MQTHPKLAADPGSCGKQPTGLTLLYYKSDSAATLAKAGVAFFCVQYAPAWGTNRQFWRRILSLGVLDIGSLASARSADD
jgi:hypothetical protein